MAAPFEKQAHIARGFRVALVSRQTGHARTKTALDVVLQARPRVAARQINRAGRHEEPLVNKMQNPSRQTRRKVGAEIERTVFLDSPSEIYARIFFAGRELDVRICLVVAKDDVELRPVLLDEIVFERQGFAFVANQNGFQLGDLPRQRAGLRVDPA